jgi:lipopolysaccharide export system protein LptC
LTIASRIDGATSGSFPTSYRRDHIGRDHSGRDYTGRDSSVRDHDRAFRVALRHSRLVRFMRVGIPACLLIAAATFGVFHWLDPMRVLAKLPVGTDGIVLSGSKIIMRQPRLNGYTKDERPYLVTARSAAKDLTNPDMLELDDIRTTIAIPGGGNVEVTASQGLYSGKAETIRLQRNVLVSSSEYEVSLREALVDVRAGSVVSEQPVEVRMLQGTISANRLEVRESGAVIRFGGGVTLVIDRGDAPLNIGAAP